MIKTHGVATILYVTDGVFGGKQGSACITPFLNFLATVNEIQPRPRMRYGRTAESQS